MKLLHSGISSTQRHTDVLSPARPIANAAELPDKINPLMKNGNGGLGARGEGGTQRLHPNPASHPRPSLIPRSFPGRNSKLWSVLLRPGPTPPRRKSKRPPTAKRREPAPRTARRLIMKWPNTAAPSALNRWTICSDARANSQNTFRSHLRPGVGHFTVIRTPAFDLLAGDYAREHSKLEADLYLVERTIG